MVQSNDTELIAIIAKQCYDSFFDAVMAKVFDKITFEDLPPFQRDAWIGVVKVAITELIKTYPNSVTHDSIHKANIDADFKPLLTPHLFDPVPHSPGEICRLCGHSLGGTIHDPEPVIVSNFHRVDFFKNGKDVLFTGKQLQFLHHYFRFKLDDSLYDGPPL